MLFAVVSVRAGAGDLWAIRAATGDDGLFLADMLLEAVNHLLSR